MTSTKSPWWKRLWDRCNQIFQEQSVYLWPHLSRAINLMVIVNVSLFFLTGTVRHGYYFPIISLCLLALATLLILLPLGLQKELPFYFAVMGLCLTAGWFLAASIVYWFKHGV